jgi:hypothetical protein
MIQATSGARPIRKLAIQNSKDVLRFDGIAQFLDTANFASAITQPYQIIIAASLTGTPTLEADLIGGSFDIVSLIRPRWSGGSALMFAGAVLTQPNIAAGTCILGGVFDGANSRFLLDGDIKASGNAGAAALTKIRVARQTNNVQTAYMACDIYEAVVIKTNDVDERQLTEGYVAWRWGLQGSLPAGHPYENAAPAIGGGIIPILRQHYAAQGAR